MDGLSVYIKNEAVRRAMDRASKSHNSTLMDSHLAPILCRNKKMRYLRDKEYMYIGRDTKFKKTVLYFKPNLKIKKIGNKYRIEGL